MKMLGALFSALLLFSSVSFGADSEKSATPASAPRNAEPQAPVKTPPKGVSAVDSANSAQEPGKLRPTHQAIPQIVVPLRGSRSKDQDSSSVTGSGIDEDAARCAARKTRSERRACKAAKK